MGEREEGGTKGIFFFFLGGGGERGCFIKRLMIRCLLWHFVLSDSGLVKAGWEEDYYIHIYIYMYSNIRRMSISKLQRSFFSFSSSLSSRFRPLFIYTHIHRIENIFLFSRKKALPPPPKKKT